MNSNWRTTINKRLKIGSPSCGYGHEVFHLIWGISPEKFTSWRVWLRDPCKFVCIEKFYTKILYKNSTRDWWLTGVRYMCSFEANSARTWFTYTMNSEKQAKILHACAKRSSAWRRHCNVTDEEASRATEEHWYFWEFDEWQSTEILISTTVIYTRVSWGLSAKMKSHRDMQC